MQLRPGDTVVDVGGNIGLFSMYAREVSLNICVVYGVICVHVGQIPGRPSRGAHSKLSPFLAA